MCYQLNEGLGGKWGSKINVSNGGQQNSNWQTLSMWLKKQTIRPRPQRCVRKHFPLISFLSQWKIQLMRMRWTCGTIMSDLQWIILKKCLRYKYRFLSNYWLLVFFVVLPNKVASLQSSLRFLKVVCLSCSKLDLHLPDDFHIRLLSSTLHFLRLLELNKNSVNETPKNTDSQSRMTDIVLVEQGKGSWSDDVVERGYCLLASLFEGCEPVLLPQLLDGLGDEIVSCLLYPY